MAGGERVASLYPHGLGWLKTALFSADWIFLLQPLLHGLGVLRIDALDRLLGREAPAGKVVAHGAHRQLDAARMRGMPTRSDKTSLL